MALGDAGWCVLFLMRLGGATVCGVVWRVEEMLQWGRCCGVLGGAI